MTIKTEHQATRVWVAYDDNTYDGPGSKIGWGETEQEAVADLMAQIEEEINKMSITMKFPYRGKMIEIFREDTHYTIVIDGHLRDSGWPRLTSANAMARVLIDSDLTPVDPET